MAQTLGLSEATISRVSRALGIICNRPAPILKACRGDQVETYLKPTIRGERWECFALTEPEAGSDAGGLRTAARRADRVRAVLPVLRELRTKLEDDD